jgi:hypothetical protein
MERHTITCEKTMRRKILTVGLLLLLAGVFIFEQGPQFLSPIAQAFGLASNYQTEIPLLPSTLIAVSPANYTSISADLKGGVQVEGSLQVADGHEVAFYVMDEGNFSQWRAGRPSAIILARPTVISSNFTFAPKTGGTYYFVFDNSDTARRVVIFSLGTVEDITILSPFIKYAAFEILAIGILLCILGVTGGKKRKQTPPKPEPAISTPPEPEAEDKWKCKFCGALNAPGQMFCDKCGRSQS